MLTLITGGARSGKSSFAQSLCESSSRVIYVATAPHIDPEMCERISLHRKQRPASWVTIEERIAVPAVIAEHAPKTEVVLVDCLTLWLSNLLYEWRDDDTATLQRKAREQTAEFTDACNSGKVIAVTNEVGSGIVPESALARRFRDVHGFMNQQMARAAAEVYLLVSGIPLRIKAVT